MNVLAKAPGDSGRGMTIALAAAVAYAALLWVVSTPYTGIYHDGIVYALLVARWLDPAAFARELFFAFGSQDALSLFTPFYGALVGQLGLADAARLVVLAGGVLWLVGCLMLARAMFGRTWLVALALLLAAGLKLSYSPNFSTFTYNENFATARTLALPLGVLALAALVAGRQRWFWVLAAASAAFHPLHGIWLPMLHVALKLTPRGLAVAAGIGLLTLLAGGLLGIPPFGLMSADWLATVRASSVDIFSGGWGALRLGDMLLTVGVLWLAGKTASPSLRELYLRLAWLTALALLVFQICSEFLPIALVMQVQPWRILWLSQLLAIFAVCDLLGLAAGRGRSHLALALMILATAWASTPLRPFIPYLLVALSAWPRSDLVLAKLIAALDRPPVLAAVGVTITIALAPVYWLSLGIAGNAVAVSLFADQPELRGFLFAGGEGLALLAAASALRWRAAAWGILLCTIPALAWEGMRWDHRPAAIRAQESIYLPADGRAPWSGLPIRRGEVVAWYPQGLEVWAGMRTATYGTDWQSIGMVFSEGRMREIRRRLERVSAAMLMADPAAAADDADRRQFVRTALAEAGQDWLNLHKYGQGALTVNGAAFLCLDPIVDWVVVPHRAVAGREGIAFDPAPLPLPIQFLHDCRAIRARAVLSSDRSGAAAVREFISHFTKGRAEGA